MKRFTFAICALLLVSINLQAAGGWGAILSGRTTASAVTEYFGYTTTASLTSSDDWGGYTIRNNNALNPFTCPGSGTRVVQSLEIWCRSVGGVPGVLLIAIYDTSLNLVGQGTAAVTVSSTTAGWVGHTTTLLLKPAGGIAGQAVNLTGGTNYILAYSCSSGDTKIPYNPNGNTMYFQNTNNTAGFPNPLGGSETIFGEQFGARIGVQ